MSLCKLGDIEFEVVSDERPQLANEVTDRPVEDIGSVSDHVENKPLVFAFDGLATGNNAFQKLQTLRQYWKDKTLLQYVGRNAIMSVVIEVLNTTHNNRNARGFSFSITLKQIRVAKVELAQIQAPDPAIPRIAPVTTQTKDISDKGVQPTQRKTVDLDSLRNKTASVEVPKPPAKSLADILNAQFPHRTMFRGGVR